MITIAQHVTDHFDRLAAAGHWAADPAGGETTLFSRLLDVRDAIDVGETRTVTVLHRTVPTFDITLDAEDGTLRIAEDG